MNMSGRGQGYGKEMARDRAVAGGGDLNMSR